MDTVMVGIHPTRSFLVRVKFKLKFFFALSVENCQTKQSVNKTMKRARINPKDANQLLRDNMFRDIC